MYSQLRELKIEVAAAPVLSKTAAAAKAKATAAAAKATKRADPNHFYSDTESETSLKMKSSLRNRRVSAS